MYRLAKLAVLLLFVSCGALSVRYDYDKSTNFSNYNSYNYYPDMDTGMNDFDAKRLLQVLDAKMREKGMLLSEEPDFYINIKSTVFQAPQNSAVGVGLGGTGRNVGGGVSVGIPVSGSKMQREIQFDFVDNQKDALFWQAISVANFREKGTPADKELELKELVAKVLAKYPPKIRR